MCAPPHVLLSPLSRLSSSLSFPTLPGLPSLLLAPPLSSAPCLLSQLWSLLFWRQRRVISRTLVSTPPHLPNPCPGRGSRSQVLSPCLFVTLGLLGLHIPFLVTIQPVFRVLFFRPVSLYLMSQGVPAHPCFVKSEQTVLIGEFRGTKASQQLSTVTEDSQTTRPQKGLFQQCCYHATSVVVGKGLLSRWQRLCDSTCKSFQPAFAFKLILL